MRPEYTNTAVHMPRRVRSSLTYLILSLATVLAAVAVYRSGVHIAGLEARTITLYELPWALLLSVARLTVTFAVALAFALLVGILAARTWFGERLIIPALDILQSVPIVGFFPAAVAFFIGLGNGHRLSVELAAMFLIFTSMVWNMAFSVYESVKSIPRDNLDAVTSFGVVGSRRLWKLYLPVSIPRLVYNSIMSWSNGWFFLVASEIIAVGPIRYDLPGIGSFLARAAESNDIPLVLWGLLALTLTIILFDQLIWRPASVWSQRYRQESSPGEEEESTPFGSLPQTIFSRISPWLSRLIRRGRKLMRALLFPIAWVVREILVPLAWDLPVYLYTVARLFVARAASRIPDISAGRSLPQRLRRLAAALIDRVSLQQLQWAMLGGIATLLALFLWRWVAPPWPPIAERIPGAILASTARLAVAILISLAWILPLALFCWNRPRLRRGLSTLAQIGASIPATALFPLILIVVTRRLGGTMEFASLLLLLTGMQWYLLFNALGGTAAIPNDFAEAVRAFGLSRAQIWRKLVIPAIRPALFTGLITAWGGGWNALVVSEYVLHQGQIMKVNGLGSLLSEAVYELGDGRSISLCIAAMVGWILFLNTVLWRPIYRFTIERYKFET